MQVSLSWLSMKGLYTTQEYRNPSGGHTCWGDCLLPTAQTSSPPTGHLPPPAPNSLPRANNNQTPDKGYLLAGGCEKPQFTYNHLSQHKQSLSELRAMARHFPLGQLQTASPYSVTSKRNKIICCPVLKTKHAAQWIPCSSPKVTAYHSLQAGLGDGG